ncbi:MAG TPA: sulfotransferase domain-containing protein [Anaerolineales bacterium]|nr:sulfotransferase domain-containing protein [Anaerolineales bacterium]
MTANLLVITARNRKDPLGVVDPSDFEFEVGDEIDPQVLVTTPRITLYCLDHAHQRALFVENSPGVNLSKEPFYYKAQYENAVNLYSVSYDTLHELAKDISLDSSRLVIVYSVGRAGSTLVDSAINEVSGVVGVSEPDVFTQLVAFRDFEGSNVDEISALVNTCMKLQCKPTEQIPSPIAWAVKFRSFCIEIGDLVYKHFPHTKNIYLYRNLEPWLLSNGRAFLENNDSLEYRAGWQQMGSYVVPFIARRVRENGPLLRLSEMGAQMWLANLERYLELHESGMPWLALRFEDIKSAPQEAVKEIIDYCGFPNVNMDAVYKSLERDSQAGSPISQEILAGSDFMLTDEMRADLTQALAAHPTIRSGDYVVPSTWVRK